MGHAGPVDQTHAYRFVENPSAPEFFCHHLHEVEVIGSATRFIPVVFKKGHDGETWAEPPFTVIFPNEAVGPALVLTWQRMPNGVIVPAIGHMMRRAFAVH